MDLEQMLERAVIQLRAELKLLEEVIPILEQLAEIRRAEVSGEAPEEARRKAMAAAR